MNISGISNMNLSMINSVAQMGTPGVVGGGAACMGRMDQLIQLIQGFSSAEIMTAMLMSHGPASLPPESSRIESFATASLGLAMSTQMAGIASMGSFMPVAAASVAGAQISVQA